MLLNFHNIKKTVICFVNLILLYKKKNTHLYVFLQNIHFSIFKKNKTILKELEAHFTGMETV